MPFHCPTCGGEHEGLPDLAFDLPLAVQQIPEAEWGARVGLVGDDLCILDDEHFFIRGIIEVPIHDHPERFGLNVWVSQEQDNFWTYVDHYESSEIGPFFGWLSNALDYGGEPVINLKTMAHFRGGSLRPSIEIEPTGHPLARDQRDGITLDRAWEMVHHYLG